ncbi:unnamed protein product [Paramecium octaurelia]|uniref:H-type lectin domain-containing protein n=1 Tax=Paramecium octaurelia TaxID=43137 RepID=A0A8S1XNJ3_PAROT|nr:unnamed protein product [Paramecium octaurelia]
MILISFLFICLINQAYGFLKYDSGTVSGFSECTTGYQQTYTINFNGVFANVPKVILGLELIDMGEGADYRIQTQNIQTTSFELFITCVTSTPFHNAKYGWYAIDDQRIQVINNFNMLNPTQQTFPHQNANANFGIVTLTSMGIYQDVNFKLYISSITTTQVTVSIVDTVAWRANLKQVGYQVILGIEEAFADIDVLYHTSDYDSGTLTQYSNKWLFLTYNGLDSYTNLRSRAERQSGTLSYTVVTWYGAFLKNYFLQGWLAYQFTTIFKPFECLTLRISQAYDFDVSTKPDIFLEINELSQSFLASTNIIIDKALSIVNMKIYMKCIKTKKIVSQFLKCQNCSTNKMYQFSHYCHGTINEISYFPRFKLVDSAYKEININIVLNRIKITQVLYNQVQSIETLVDIQIQDV